MYYYTVLIIVIGPSVLKKCVPNHRDDGTRFLRDTDPQQLYSVDGKAVCGDLNLTVYNILLYLNVPQIQCRRVHIQLKSERLQPEIPRVTGASRYRVGYLRLLIALFVVVFALL